MGKLGRRIRAGLLVVTIAAMPFVGIGQAFAAMSVASIDVASATPSGQPGDRDSYNGGMSSDARYIAFSSIATDIIPGIEYPLQTELDNSPAYQIFVRDLVTNTAEVVSHSATGDLANRSATEPQISDDGRIVTFHSDATNLVPGVTPALGQVGLYLIDRQANTTILVSDPADSFINMLPHNMSRDGSVLAYTTLTDVRIYNRLTDTTTSVPTWGLRPRLTHLSANGRYLLYDVRTTDPVFSVDAYRYDTVTAQATLVYPHVNLFGADVSPDGSKMIYCSRTEPGFPPGFSIYVKDIDTGVVTLVESNVSDFSLTAMSMSVDNRYVTYITHPSGGPSGLYNQKVADLATGETLTVATNVSRNSFATLSADGSKLLFDSANQSGSTRNQVYLASLNLEPPDTTPPAITSLSWSANPLLQGQNTTLAVSASDNSGTVQRVEYYVGTDPGQGNATAMALSSGQWTATFGASLAVNTYNIGIRAQDGAGNWSPLSADVLAVYNAANGYVTGHARFTPNSNDTLPIPLATTNNPNQPAPRVVVGFTNLKAATSTTPTSGSFDLEYVVKNNQDEVDISSSLVDWVVVPDNNHASILGHATMSVYQNGVMTTYQNVPIRIDVTAGSSTTADHVLVKIYDVGANPNSDAPHWQLDDDMSTVSQVLIKV